MSKKNKEVSSCCKAELITHISDEGTGYYECSKCHKPCDQYVEQPELGHKDSCQCKCPCHELGTHNCMICSCRWPKYMVAKDIDVPTKEKRLCNHEGAEDKERCTRMYGSKFLCPLILDQVNIDQPESGQKCIVYTGGSHCHCHDKPGICTSDMTSCNHCSPNHCGCICHCTRDLICKAVHSHRSSCSHCSPQDKEEGIEDRKMIAEIIVKIREADLEQSVQPMVDYILKIREQAFREGQKNGKAVYKGQAVREAYQRGYDEAKAEIKSRVGMLRQWLNEDRIRDAGKMVTNDQLEDWLDLSKKEDK